MHSIASEKYFAIAGKHFSHCTKDEIEYYASGYEHDVFLVKKRYVFRFPITKKAVMHDAIEAAFIKNFIKHSPVPLQQITNYIDEKTGLHYQTYEYIPGVPFTEKISAGLEKKELLQIAMDIGKFLKALHTFSISKAEDLDIYSHGDAFKYVQYFKNILEEDKKVIGGILDKKEWEWVATFINKFFILIEKNPFSLTVIHSDLVSDHILVDPQTHRLNGIIDFSLKIADPANDFKILDLFGEEFLKTVYTNYLPVDTYFDERRKFYSGDFFIGRLYLAVKNNEAENTEFYLKKLKRYIAAHEV